MIDFYDEYNALANAIVERAVNDFRISLEYLKEHQNDDMSKPALEYAYRRHAKMKIDCIRFFKSGWYQNLTMLDGGKVMSVIREQVRNGIKVDNVWRGTRHDSERFL